MPRKLTFKSLAARQMALDLETEQANRPPPPDIPCCEAPYCLRPGHFVFSEAGWQALKNRHRERQFYCAAHKPD